MKLPSITQTQEQVSNLAESLHKEWLITNGVGGYASSTVSSINTRKYHGLLVAALNPPGNRVVCVSKIDEDLFFGDDVYRLGSNNFLDTIYPQGYKLISQFSLSPYPTYIYEVDGVKLTKTIFMPQGKNVVYSLYQISNTSKHEGKILIYPILNCRYFHNVTKKHSNSMSFNLTQAGKQVDIYFPSQDATVTCRCTEGDFNGDINWIEKMVYQVDASNGESSVDDCFQPGFFEVTVPTGESKFAVEASVNEVLDDSELEYRMIEDSYRRELKRQNDSLGAFYNFNASAPVSDWLSWIAMAADSFVVQNADDEKSVIAGYHWFEPWGRDTFISIPGLLLVKGRFLDAKNVLQSFSQHIKDGLIPNYIEDESGKAGYNTVDATLWFVNALWQYLKYTQDYSFVQNNLWLQLQEIIDWHQKGTLFGIHLDSDGLLSHGPRLTWMDAMVDGNAITARDGKAVEIQALWYNTLKIMQALAGKFQEDDLEDKYTKMANNTYQSFNSKFWYTKRDYLIDVYSPNGVDAALRPNQIFAVSLDFSILDREKSKKVVQTVQDALVTPYGLRTLSLDDPNFVGMCTGERGIRDKAYHNGTIWPWLLGPFITAYVKVNDYSAVGREFAAKNYIEALLGVAVGQAGLGTVSEIYDCDPPNEPRGCISQSWSVAEPLRAYIEDVLMIRPAPSLNQKSRV